MNTPSLLLLAALCGAAACAEPARPGHLDCVVDPGAPLTECGPLGDEQVVQQLLSSDARELWIDAVTARRAGGTLIVDVRLAGRFWNEIDQNLFVFLGAEGAPSTYALSADPAYASEAGYAVRGAVALPHADDVRVGVMAPAERSYSPQVYVNDPVHAEAVGPSAGVVQRVEGRDVHLEIPLDRYYAARKAPVPERLGVTVATARDYVGFVDQISARDLPAGGAATSAERAAPPMAYPTLDPRSHRFERVAVRAAGGSISVELTMAAPILDWAQTNLQVLFFPSPPRPATRPLRDPSKTRPIPFQWSYACSVYAPRRIFCKASRGRDFAFDAAYAERASLTPPEGVALRDLGEGRYALDLPAQEAAEIAPRGAPFAVVVAAGRDGFGPTSWYGVGTTP